MTKSIVFIQYADQYLVPCLRPARCRRWASAAALVPMEITLRFVGNEEARRLNCQYRKKDVPTNVLTFILDTPMMGSDRIIADIVICTDVLCQQAREQKKSVYAHGAHLIVHGVLHAQGYDHDNDEDCARMENLEKRILRRLGWANPYGYP